MCSQLQGEKKSRPLFQARATRILNFLPSAKFVISSSKHFGQSSESLNSARNLVSLEHNRHFSSFWILLLDLMSNHHYLGTQLIYLAQCMAPARTTFFYHLHIELGERHGFIINPDNPCCN